jgi:hypothetical protein
MAVFIIHYLWFGFFPERDPVQDRWQEIVPATQTSWLVRYVKTESYWFGYSYGLSLAFAAVALRRYREAKFCKTKNLAIGGFTLTGFLAVMGCYLIGCCGSPMLVVYLNLFGATFFPLAKPLLAVLTTLTIVAVWLWLNYRIRSEHVA